MRIVLACEVGYINQTDPVTHQVKVVSHRTVFVEIEASLQVPIQYNVSVVCNVDDAAHVDGIANLPISRGGLPCRGPRQFVHSRCDCDARSSIVRIWAQLYAADADVMRKLPCTLRALDFCANN